MSWAIGQNVCSVFSFPYPLVQIIFKYGDSHPRIGIGVVIFNAFEMSIMLHINGSVVL